MKKEQIYIGVITAVVVALVFFLMRRGAEVLEILPGTQTGLGNMGAGTPFFGGTNIGDSGGNIYNLGGYAGGGGGGGFNYSGGIPADINGNPGAPKSNGNCCCGSGDTTFVLQPPRSILEAMPKIIPPTIEPAITPRLTRQCVQEALDYEGYVIENPDIEKAYITLSKKNRQYLASLGYGNGITISREAYGQFLFSHANVTGDKRTPPTKCMEYDYV